MPNIVVDFSPLHTPTQKRGIGRYLQTLAQGLSRLDAKETRDLRVLALLSVDLSGRCRVTDNPAEVLSHKWRSEPSQLDRYRWAYARRVALWSVVRRLNARLVHLGDPNATPIGMSFGRCKRVVTCHDLIPLQFPSIYLGPRDGFGVVGKRLIRRRFRSADHVVAISDATRKELIQLLDVPPQRITRVYNGVDLSSWSAVDPGDDDERVARLGLGTHNFVLYVGDTDWRKNPEAMIDGLASAAKAGADVDLAFVGKLEAHKVQHLRRLAQRAGIQRRIHLLGYVSDSDLRALYRTALAHLFVSRFEGFGYTVIEAMTSGCPVITTNCGSLAEVAGQAALLVDPDNPQDIGEAICSLQSDAQKRTELIQRGIGWAQQFSCEAQARGMLDVFRRLLD